MKRILTLLAFLPMLAPFSAMALGNPPKYFKYCRPQYVVNEDVEVVATTQDSELTHRLGVPPSHTTNGVPGPALDCDIYELVPADSN